MKFQVDRAKRYFESGSMLLPLVHTDSRICLVILSKIYGIYFALIYIILVTLLLFLSITIAIRFSSRFFVSINNLITASEQIGKGDLNTKVPDIKTDVEIEIITNKSIESQEILLHSSAHLLAQAIKVLYPKAKIAIGPALADRFYYDIDIDISINEEELVKIEKKMKVLTKENFPL